MNITAKILLFIVFISPIAVHTKLSLLEQKVLDKVENYLQEQAITGLAIALITKENHQNAHHLIVKGSLSKISPIPINQYSQFRIGLMTQLFTAGALAYFVQEGQVNLNDPIAKFLPKSIKLPTYQGQEITLGDLATHTSGLPNLPYHVSNDASFTVGQMFRLLKNFELKRPPGTEYEYSNLGYACLSTILMRISKQSFPDLINQILIAPLHLQETNFSLTNEQKKRAAIGYEQDCKIFPTKREKIYSIFIGTGGLYSTACNMITWLSFNMGQEKTSLNRLLPIMQKSYHTFERFSMGLGWKITPFNKTDELFSIGGILFGCGTYMGIVPALDIGIMIMTSQPNLPVQEIGEEILKMLEKQ